MKRFFFDLDKNIATTSRLKTVCFEETYGRHILRKLIANLHIGRALDIGSGEGHDLAVLREYFPKAYLSAIDHKDTHFEKLTNQLLQMFSLGVLQYLNYNCL